MLEDLDTEDTLLRRGFNSQVNFRPEDFHDHVVIGRGKDSTIYSAKCDPLGGRTVAVKLYNKAKLSASKLRAIKREAAMMAYITRKGIPNVTRLYGAFQDQHQVWLVMELGEGGDLLQKLLAEGRAMGEAHVCQNIALPLLTTLKAVHELHIIHRDLKLENIFLSKEGDIMLGDYGLTMSTKQELAVSPVGTVEYMAPEVVALPPVDAVTRGLVRTCDITPCTDRVDIWALGVTLYELLTGHLPFEGRDKVEVKRSIAAGRLRPMPLSLSALSIEFVVSMLEYDPARRPSAAQLLEHPFVRLHCQQLSSYVPAGLPVGRDDTAHDLGSADKKNDALQAGLGEFSRTSVESGPLIMARHGSPLVPLSSLGSLGSSIASERSITPCPSERSQRASPSPSRMSRGSSDLPRSSPGRMRPRSPKDTRPSHMGRPHTLAKHPLDTAASGALPQGMSSSQASPQSLSPASTPSPLQSGQLPNLVAQQSALGRMTSFMKSLFGAEPWDGAASPR